MAQTCDANQTSDAELWRVQPPRWRLQRPKHEGHWFSTATNDRSRAFCGAAETTIAVQPNLSDWSKLENDKVVVQTLDAGNMRVISHVLSQSVALDYFNS